MSNNKFKIKKKIIFVVVFLLTPRSFVFIFLSFSSCVKYLDIECDFDSSQCDMINIFRLWKEKDFVLKIPLNIICLSKRKNEKLICAFMNLIQKKYKVI